jgi:hypothetical protein
MLSSEPGLPRAEGQWRGKTFPSPAWRKEDWPDGNKSCQVP